MKTSTQAIRPLLVGVLIGAMALLLSPIHVSPSGSLAYQPAEAGKESAKATASSKEKSKSKGSGGGKSGSDNSGGNGEERSGINKPELVFANPFLGAEASSLGRWIAAKPIDHPAIQARIRNGNFTGTIGMMARYILAQNTLNEMQAGPDFVARLAEAQTVLDVEAADPAQTAFTDGQIVAAQALIDSYNSAISGLAKAETLMARYSNRAPWEEIRTTVRLKLGLDPEENDLL